MWKGATRRMGIREAETIVKVFVSNKKEHKSILLTSGCSHGNGTEAITIYEAE